MNVRNLTVGLLAATALLAPAARADEFSGPGRNSLSPEAWGTIYYVPMALQDYEYRRDVDKGKRWMTSLKGPVEITDTGIGQYELSYARGKVTVEGTSTQAKVDFFGKKYQFTHAPNSFTIKTPDDEIHYTFDAHRITATGKKGTLKIVEKDGDYQVESPVGKYSYTPQANGGFVVKGGPLAKHPYLYRGALFQEAGVGIFIDFKKLDAENPLFLFVDWAPMLEIAP